MKTMETICDMHNDDVNGDDVNKGCDSDNDIPDDNNHGDDADGYAEDGNAKPNHDVRDGRGHDDTGQCEDNDDDVGNKMQDLAMMMLLILVILATPRQFMEQQVQPTDLVMLEELIHLMEQLVNIWKNQTLTFFQMRRLLFLYG